MKTHTDKNGVKWEEYTDPLASEPANPYKWVDGYKVKQKEEGK